LRNAPYGVPPPWGWSLEKVLYWLQVSAFLVPVVAGLWGWGAWHRARLSPRRMRRVEDVFRAALREREFDEVERIVQRNRDQLHRLPATAVAVLFSPPMVSALMQAQSLVHLELLADLTFLMSLSNRYQAVDVAVRELLRSEISPMRPAVFTQFGGLEHITYSDDERRLMERTFENPEWYHEAGAHYPLVVAAVEALRSGALDREYNEAGDHYETSQGVSRRAHCPVFLAEKTEVLALQSVVRQGVERDFYVTDLLDIFRAVQERSRVTEAWNRPLKERPTPFAYLLYEIGSDLSDLSGEALQKAVSKADVPEVAKPASVANALALTWSFCVWNIADSEGQVSDDFRTTDTTGNLCSARTVSSSLHDLGGPNPRPSCGSYI
jgi:hypothetical protein